MSREENLILPNLTKLICDEKEREMVPVYKTDKGEYVVSATELHRTLGVRSNYRDWIKNRLNDCDATEGEDFQTFAKKLSKGRPTQEYIIKLDTAKEMSMLERNEKGKQVRRYFIEVEKKYKQTGSVEKTLAQFIQQQTEFNQKMLSLVETQTPQIETREPVQDTATSPTNPFNPNKDLVKERLAKLNGLVTEVQELHGLKRNMTLHFLYDTIAEDCDTNLNSYLTVYRTETGNKEASTLHVIAASDRFYEQALKNFDYAIKRKKVFG